MTAYTYRRGSRSASVYLASSGGRLAYELTAWDRSAGLVRFARGTRSGTAAERAHLCRLAREWCAHGVCWCHPRGGRMPQGGVARAVDPTGPAR